MINFLLPLLLLTGLLANYVPEGSSCKCVNPFSGTRQAFLGDKELTCETNQLCYVPCDSLCGDVEHATAKKDRCVSRLACNFKADHYHNHHQQHQHHQHQHIHHHKPDVDAKLDKEQEVDVKSVEDSDVVDAKPVEKLEIGDVKPVLKPDVDMIKPAVEMMHSSTEDTVSVSAKSAEEKAVDVVQPGEEEKANPDNFLNIDRSSPPLQTYEDSEPEHHLWYFREDPSVSSYRNYWRELFKGTRDRRGEVWFHMHRQMVIRYAVERLTHNMTPVAPFSPDTWRQPIPLGYSPKLEPEIGFEYQARPEMTVLSDLGGDGTPVPVSKLEQWHEEIIAAIKNMTVVADDGTIRELKVVGGRDEGISILTDLVESYDSVNPELYGSLHNNLHMIIAWVLGPARDDGTKLGVMGTTAKSIRDPMFFRLHKFIDDILYQYKTALPAYTEEELSFPGVEVLEAFVTTESKKNELRTVFDNEWEVKLKAVMLDGKIYDSAKYKRLVNLPFHYDILVNSSSDINAMVRIFLLPKKSPDPMAPLAIEMDRFLVQLNEGKNKIKRKSTESSVTERRRNVLLEFDAELSEKKEGEEATPEADLYDGCGWPRHLLVPKGTSAGDEFSLLVVLSKLLPDDAALTADQEEVAKYAFVTCGLPGGMPYPDSRPMGFPFDRPVTWEVEGMGNMWSTDVKIYL